VRGSRRVALAALAVLACASVPQSEPVSCGWVVVEWRQPDALVDQSRKVAQPSSSFGGACEAPGCEGLFFPFSRTGRDFQGCAVRTQSSSGQGVSSSFAPLPSSNPLTSFCFCFCFCFCYCSLLLLIVTSCGFILSVAEVSSPLLCCAP
jgi:hypothetical protein